MPNFNLNDRYPIGIEVEWEHRRRQRFNFFSGVNQDYPKIEDYQTLEKVLSYTKELSARPTELQQIKGNLENLRGKFYKYLKEHPEIVEREKEKDEQYK